MKSLIIISTVFFFLINSCSTSKDNTISDATSKATEESADSKDYFGNYSIIDSSYKTQTIVKIEKEYRVMSTNALPNHKTGKFPNSGNPNSISAQRKTYKFPLNPKYVGKAKRARQPGIALNGIKFEPETAEMFVCETGEVFRIEAFQKLVDLGLDFNNAHVQPTGEYHYHGIPIDLVNSLYMGEDLVLVGFAMDGFPIYCSKSNAYKPSYQLSEKTRTGDVCSYSNPKTKIDKKMSGTTPDGTFVSDWEFVKGLGDLDECNGITINGKYIYLLTETYPYVGRCLMGEFEEEKPMGPPPGGGNHPHPPHPHHHN